jgi:hypothetical protein
MEAEAEGFCSMNPSRTFVRTANTIAMEESGTMILLHVASIAALAGFPAQHVFTRVEYRMACRQIWLQDTRSSALQRARVVLRAEDVGVTVRVLENEVLNLLQRGHSCMAASCRCSTGLSSARTQDLGIVNRARAGGACAARPVQGFTCAELQHELGVTGLDAVAVGGRSIREILSAGSFFVYTGCMWRLSRACTVADKGALLIYVQMSPFGVDLDAAGIQYPGLARDARALQHERELLILPGVADDKRRLFRTTTRARPCDADIAALWHRVR